MENIEAASFTKGWVPPELDFYIENPEERLVLKL